MPPLPYASILRSDLEELASYQPAPNRYEVRLDANEAPPFISDEARERVGRAMAETPLHRYPDARMTELRSAIAERSGVRPEEVLVGTGSDEVIALLLTALDRPRRDSASAAVLTPWPTFVMYRLSARARGFRMVEVPLDEAWDLDVGEMRRAIEASRPNVIFIATPNNPTAAMMSEDRVEAIVEAAADALVVVDEAYIDYGSRAQSALRRHPNVAILRTLSKIGFAALRVGWLIGPAELVAEVDKVRQPFNVSAPVQRAATIVLRELGAEIDRIRRAVIAERERVATELRAMGLGVPPSDANFLWVDTRRPAREVVDALAERGVLIKSFRLSSTPSDAEAERLSRHARITVGLPAENDRLLYEIAKCV